MKKIYLKNGTLRFMVEGFRRAHDLYTFILLQLISVVDSFFINFKIERSLQQVLTLYIKITQIYF